MTMSTGSRAKFGLITETVFGTTPSTPALAELPILSSSINLAIEQYRDGGIHSDGLPRYLVGGNRSVAGTIDVNFAHGQFDTLLESLMQSSFATNVLKKGTTRKSFTLEEGQLDISQYRVWTGTVVDKMDLTMPASGYITAKFAVVAKDQAVGAASIDTDGYTPATAKNPLTAKDAAGFIKEGGSTAGYISNIQLTIDNSYDKDKYVLGSTTVYDFAAKTQLVTGNLTAFFIDNVMYAKFLNGTASSLDLKFSDGTNSVEFLIPNIKYSVGTKTFNGNGTVELQLSFEALYDATSGSNLVITRT